MSKIKELLEEIPDNIPKKIDALASALSVKNMLENNAKFARVNVDENGEPLTIERLTNIKTILFYCFNNISIIESKKEVRDIILVKNEEMEDIAIFAFDENGEKVLLMVKEETLLLLNRGQEVIKILKGDDEDVSE